MRTLIQDPSLPDRKAGYRNETTFGGHIYRFVRARSRDRSRARESHGNLRSGPILVTYIHSLLR